MISHQKYFPLPAHVRRRFMARDSNVACDEGLNVWELTACAIDVFRRHLVSGLRVRLVKSAAEAESVQPCPAKNAGHNAVAIRIRKNDNAGLRIVKIFQCRAHLVDMRERAMRARELMLAHPFVVPSAPTQHQRHKMRLKPNIRQMRHGSPPLSIFMPPISPPIDKIGAFQYKGESR